jgi:hypothetical protein
MDPFVDLLNRPGDRRRGSTEMPGNLCRGKVKLGGCPIGYRSPSPTRFGASATALHLPGVDLPRATLFINKPKHNTSCGFGLHLSTLVIFRFLKCGRTEGVKQNAMNEKLRPHRTHYPYLEQVGVLLVNLDHLSVHLASLVHLKWVFIFVQPRPRFIA